MHEQQGCFNGIDTCNVTNFRQFDFRSKLLRDAESWSIINRPDINALLNDLVKDKSITKVVANDKRNYTTAVSENTNFEKYCIGATYVPLEYTILMKKDLLNSGGIIKSIIDDRGVDANGNQLPEITLSYPKYWPSILYPCQKMDKYGAMFQTVPLFSSKKVSPHKLSLCWMISSLLLSCQEFWTVISSQQMRTSSWYGWTLVYLTKNCNLANGRQASKKEVFKFWTYIRTIEKFAEKLNVDSLSDALSGIDEIFFCDLIDDNENVLNRGSNLSQYVASLLSIEVMNDIKIVVVNSFYSNINGEIENELVLHGVQFDLKVLSMTNVTAHGKLNGEVYARHGGKQHPLWWFQEKSNYIRRHINHGPSSTHLKADHSYVLLYVRKNCFNVQTARDDFIKYLGGQCHVKCFDHRYY